MAKITYDKQSHVMSIRLKRAKSVDSDVQDNVVIDYDKQGGIVNIDVMDISLSEFNSTSAYTGEQVYVREGRAQPSYRRDKLSKNGR